MKIKVNRDACIGCGACPVIAPKLFELDEEGLSRALVDEATSDEDKENAKDASESCPTSAIEVEE